MQEFGISPPWRHASRGPLENCQCLSQPPRRQHLPVASVRSFRIVELYDTGQEFPGLFKIQGPLHPVKPFLLDDAIHPFGYRIVRRPIVLCHADCGMNSLQMFDVLIAAVLYAPVGMMDQTLKTKMGDIPDAHIQGSHGIGGDQAVGECPPNDLMGKCVCQQMQVYHSRLRVYIGDVGNP